MLSLLLQEVSVERRHKEDNGARRNDRDVSQLFLPKPGSFQCFQWKVFNGLLLQCILHHLIQYYSILGTFPPQFNVPAFLYGSQRIIRKLD